MAELTELSLLTEGRALIQDIVHWRKGGFAADASCSCDIDDPKACRFCGWGALKRVAHLHGQNSTRAGNHLVNRAACRLDAAAGHLFPGHNIVQVNDHIGHEAVLRCYDVAITEAQQEATPCAA